MNTVRTDHRDDAGLPDTGASPSLAPAAAAAPAGVHRIVIVGGGAGGLELATALGDKLGRRGRASVTLIDRALTHIWKPRLHEIAAGSMDVNAHELPYLAQSHWHHFRFRIGEMIGLDRRRREVQIAPFVDDEGEQVTPERRVGYDTLVIAIGSETSDFGTPGVAEHAIKLETPDDARRFHRRLRRILIRASTQTEPLAPHQLKLATIGAGATGVELSAELHRTTRELVAYGLDRLDPDRDLQLHLIEAAGRVLPGLPERLSASALKMLQALQVHVHTGAKVSELRPHSVHLADGREIAAELVVWAAGVKAPDVLKGLGGLESNRINQLVVRQTLQCTRDDDIFAIGDCAACAWPEAGAGSLVPPRAQSAHQQASHAAAQIQRRLAGKPLTDYRYRDFGSLVSLGHYGAVGNMMSGLGGGNLFIEGLVARGMYKLLYKMHELALHGAPKVALETMARMIARRGEPRVKLH